MTSATLAQHGVAYSSAIATAAHDHGLDPALLAAVAAQETGGPDTNAGRNVVGDGGHGHGIFQIDDRYHTFARSDGAMDPQHNAEYAAGMLSNLIRRYGSVHRALSAYNAGSPDATGTVTRWSDGARLGYADSVLRHEAGIAGAPLSSAVASAGSSAPPSQALPTLSLPPLNLPPPTHRHTFRELIGNDAAAPVTEPS